MKQGAWVEQRTNRLPKGGRENIHIGDDIYVFQRGKDMGEDSRPDGTVDGNKKFMAQCYDQVVPFVSKPTYHAPIRQNKTSRPLIHICFLPSP